MSNCTYRFNGPDGKEVTIVGMEAMKAYMVANLDFFRSLVGAEAQLGASLPEPTGARSEPTDDLEASGMVPLASRRASAAWTGETPERIRRVL